MLLRNEVWVAMVEMAMVGEGFTRARLSARKAIGLLLAGRVKRAGGFYARSGGAASGSVR